MRPLHAVLFFSASAAAAIAVAQEVSEQFSNVDPPEQVEVEVTGHILKPVALEPTDARLNNINLPPGFEISVFARDLTNPRMLAVHDSGDVYVTQPETGELIRLRDRDGDGQSDDQQVMLTQDDLHGIAIEGDVIYLVTVRELYRGRLGEAGDVVAPELLVDDLPDGGQHPNRTVVVGPDGMLYLSVGSSCNACTETNSEHATLLRVQPDGSDREIYASGLRNTIGFGFQPDTVLLYGMDHGIDWLGDNEQHEELNFIEEGQQYGWPYIYDDGQFNPADEPPGEQSWADWARNSREPIGLYVPHAAPMQMAFYTGQQFPSDYQGDAFVAMRGSWNRDPPAGYEILRIDFQDGEPMSFEAFATGFLQNEQGRWGHLGRLAGLAQAEDGSLLVSDDENGVIYRITYTGEETQEAGEGPSPTNPEDATIRLE